MQSRAEKYIGFRDRWLMIIGVPVLSLIVSLMTFERSFFIENSLQCFLVGVIFTFTYWIVFRQIIIEYHKRYPSYQWSFRRIGFVLFWSGIMFVSVNFLVGVFINYAFPFISRVASNSPSFKFLTIAVVIAMMFFLYEGIYYFNKSKIIEIEKNKLERTTAEQKLSTLKNQVNPHFLFNSLNTLITIIPDEPNLAINFVQQLSKSYRSILEHRDEKLITIADEIASLESYIFLLKTRFQGKIQIHNRIDEDIMGHFILPLSLQILIENAVKHNITSKAKPLRVEIINDDEYVIVSNNLQKKNQTYNSTKIGLENIKSRYELLADKQIKVNEGKDKFTVYLPIITNLDYANSNY